GEVSAEVRIAGGVRAGLRNYQSRVYSGSGSLAGGGAVLLSSRQNFQKSPRVVRGLASVEKTESMTIVAAQYRP
ncbi:MAG: hypothetical protein N2322_06495, partial [Terrimicrobiaceae bacterium]|nr:hypothetical protein [Terrimicrobiaceae bacterium]